MDWLRADFEEQYFGCKIFVDEFLPVYKKFLMNRGFLIVHALVTQASLEKLTIAKFGGNPKAYTGFRNLFNTIVHENSTIRPVVKFGYLKSYLKGYPLKLISNLMLTNSNYELALS